MSEPIKPDNDDGWGKLQAEVEKPKSIDPRVDPTDVAYSRMQQLVENVTTQTLQELSAFRDEIDNLMIAIRKRNEYLVRTITQHTEFCSNAIKTKQIINDSIKAIQNDFNNGPVHTIEN